MKKFLLLLQTVSALALFSTGCAGAAPVPIGFSKMLVGDGTNAITVFTYKPANYHGGPLLVVFHGMLRNGDLYCTNAAPLADRYGFVVAAPNFDTNHFSNDEYQRGGVLKRGVAQPSEKWTYQYVPKTIAAIREREGKDLPYYLIGHSAGGQFAMRYAGMMPPGAVRIVAANPGTDLFPRRDWEFGFGFGGLPPVLSDDAALQRYLAAPLTLYLGLADIDPQHPELDRTADAEREGAFRLQRGRNCFAYAQKLAADHGWQFNWRKVEVPAIAHDGKAMFAAPEAGEALFGKTQ